MLIGQRAIGAKGLAAGNERPPRHAMSACRTPAARLLKDRGDALVVTGLGSTTYDVFAAGDSPRTFYLWGAMGGAAMVGLGLALAQPGVASRAHGRRRDADGPRVARHGRRAAPDNLAIVVIDNGLYAETGMQRTHTASGVDLAGVARSCGFAHAETAGTQGGARAVVARGVRNAGAVLRRDQGLAGSDVDRARTADGPTLRSRFRVAVLGKDAGR